MLSSLKTSLATLLLVATATSFCSAANKQPLIFDSDYGPFIDDVFALGLLVNSLDIVDLKLVLATSDRPELSATCIAAQLELSGHSEIEVAVGSPFPDYSERGSVCAIQGILGFAMEPECNQYSGPPPIQNGVEYMANMIMDSGRDDWWYLVVGGQSSLRALIEAYPEAAAKIDTVIVMAGNWCADFEPYPDVMAPTDETNIGCDPAAANFVLDGNNIQFNNVYYVPVVMADEIGGDDYKVFVDATETNAAANATLTWYKIWSAAGRADENLLVHAEAMAYDPDTESTPQFDPVAVMLALELLVDDCDRMTLFEMEGIHFFEADDEGLQPFPNAPRSAFSLHTGIPDTATLPAECPNITSFTFNVTDTPEMEYPVQVALGFNSPADKAAVYADMARRMAGEKILCGKDTSTLFTDPPVETPTDAPVTPEASPTVAPVTPEASPTVAPGGDSGVCTLGHVSAITVALISMLF
ncbi:unnamed protein product [Cylindrotheca closterium]|uniref:Inosine/uridine-preferring nucleoside hydrolase domain-containing protein n=1 Tax=Cylindrotheca closterium TaxID=2856 RepID=A0AAD2JKD6_9STRA|nr:unnamed protein product [Cylindrotheca closterium]